MNKLVRIVATIVITGLLVYVCMGIFSFFDIPFAVYGNYILWLVAIVLFSIILPERVEDIFSNKSL